MIFSSWMCVGWLAGCCCCRRRIALLITYRHVCVAFLSMYLFFWFARSFTCSHCVSVLSTSHFDLFVYVLGYAYTNIFEYAGELSIFFCCLFPVCVFFFVRFLILLEFFPFFFFLHFFFVFSGLSMCCLQFHTIASKFRARISFV